MGLLFLVIMSASDLSVIRTAVKAFFLWGLQDGVEENAMQPLR